MRKLCLFLALFLPAVWADPRPPCYPLSSEWIRARDLSQAIPEFAQLPPDLAFGYAPTPGVDRVFLARDLKRIANQNLIQASIDKNICFSWTAQPLDRDKVIAAMRTALGERLSSIEIVDQNMSPVPPGELVFPMQGLSAWSEKAVIWSGYVAYAPNRRFTTWVRVKVRVSEPHWVATKAVQHGQVIPIDAFEKQNYDGPLLRLQMVSDLSQVSNMRASRDISVGSVLETKMLAPVPDIEPGDSVAVSVDFGSAHLEAPGVATQLGFAGDIILLKNPRSGRLFKARVLGKGLASAIPSSLSGLALGDDKS